MEEGILQIIERARRHLEIARALDIKAMTSDSLIDDDVNNWEYVLKLVEGKTLALAGFSRQIKLLPKNHHALLELNKIYSEIIR